MDLETALNQYGFVGDLANSIPELKGIFGQAAAGEWAPAKFERAVMDSAWYRKNAENVRFLITQQTTDPASWAQTLKNSANKVYLLQREMGMVPSSPAMQAQWAKHFLYNNYDDEQIRRFLAINGKIATGEGGHISGQAAEFEEHMRGVVTNYGVTMTQANLRSYLQKIQAGDYTMEGFESLMRVRAKAAYPQFTDQIDGGMTLRDIADPYISTMANTLEISETEVELRDSWVKKALSSKQPDGTMNAMPLWEFERKLKDDPRWDKTKQARDHAFETVAQIGRDFGFEA